jgi:hypothetical protein
MSGARVEERYYEKLRDIEEIKCGIHYPVPIHQLAPYSE